MGWSALDAERPAGWSDVFAERIRDVVLPGYTAFSRRDVARAVSLLLVDGDVRLKRPRAAGGTGQSLIRARTEIDSILATLPGNQLHESGLVLETDLKDVTTLSIGRVALDDMIVSYYGTQHLTKDNEGRTAYGGSDLVCVRGDWSALEQSALPNNIRCAVSPSSMEYRKLSALAQSLDKRAQRLAYGGHRSRDGQRQALEAAHEVDESVNVISQQLPSGAG